MTAVVLAARDCDGLEGGDKVIFGEGTIDLFTDGEGEEIGILGCDDVLSVLP